MLDYFCGQNKVSTTGLYLFTFFCDIFMNSTDLKKTDFPGVYNTHC